MWSPIACEMRGSHTGGKGGEGKEGRAGAGGKGRGTGKGTETKASPVSSTSTRTVLFEGVLVLSYDFSVFRFLFSFLSPRLG